MVYPISAKTEQKELGISNMVVSASGIYFQGNHIFDPRTGSNNFIPAYDRVWVAASDASYSNAFSTAFFLLSIKEIEEIVNRNEKIIWMAYSKDGIEFCPTKMTYWTF